MGKPRPWKCCCLFRKRDNRTRPPQGQMPENAESAPSCIERLCSYPGTLYVVPLGINLAEVRSEAISVKIWFSVETWRQLDVQPGSEPATATSEK